jgi:hypothetical protein
MPGLNAYKTISSPVSVPEQAPGQGQAPEREPVSQQAVQEAATLPVSSHNRKKQQ